MSDIVQVMRGFSADHEPDGWPAIKMRQVTELCDMIEALRHQLADEKLCHAETRERVAELLEDIASEQRWASHYAQESLGYKASLAAIEGDRDAWRDVAKEANREQWEMTTRINELATDWQVMHTKLAACEKDAERYRWLRTLDPRKYTDLWMYCLNHDVRFDEQVDEAMK